MNAIKNWIMQNPKQSAVIAASAVPVLAPGIVALPLLGVVGFGPLGPVAGSAAAALQAGVGDVVGGSAIATMQSAAMGGYGLAFVNGVVQGGSIVVATAAGLLGVGGGGGGTGSQ